MAASHQVIDTPLVTASVTQYDEHVVGRARGRLHTAAPPPGTGAPGTVTYGLNIQAWCAFVDADDGVAEADGRLVGEAGSEWYCPLLPGGAGHLVGVKGADRGFPVDRCGPGAVVDEAGEIVASELGAVGDDQPGGGRERVESLGGGAEPTGSDEPVMSTPCLACGLVTGVRGLRVRSV